MTIWPVLDPAGRLQFIREQAALGSYAVAYDINDPTEPVFSNDPRDRPDGGVWPDRRVLTVTIRPLRGDADVLGAERRGTARGALKAQQLIEELRKGKDPAEETGGKPGFFNVDLPDFLPDFLKKYGLFVLAAVVVVVATSR